MQFATPERRSQMRTLVLTVGIVIAMALLASAVHACPNCKNAHVDSDDPGASERLRDGYFWSYIAMTTMPFAAAGGITGLLFYSKRKHEQAAVSSTTTEGSK